jgi:hypothetical protein
MGWHFEKTLFGELELELVWEGLSESHQGGFLGVMGWQFLVDI